MNISLVNDVEMTLQEFINELSAFEQQEVNHIPFEGSWTAGEVARHIIKSDSGFLELIQGPEKESDRPSDQFVDQIKKAFLDFDTKMKSPDFLIPENISYDKHDLILTLTKIKKGLSSSLPNVDITKICTGFELPFLGNLTRLEAVTFVICHTRRHSYQIKNILETIRSEEFIKR